MHSLRISLNLVTAVTFCEATDWNIGVIIPRGNKSYAKTIAYETNAAALDIGLEAIKERQLLKDFNIKFIYEFSECEDIRNAGAAAKLILYHNVSAIIGPACIEAILAIAPLSTYYNIATFAWGLATSSETMLDKYSPMIPFSTTGRHYGLAFLELVRHFHWEQFAYIFYGEKCQDLGEELTAIFFVYLNTFISRSASIPRETMGILKTTLQRTSTVARIILLCLSDVEAIRNMMLAAYDSDLIGEEYLYIFVDFQDGEYVKQNLNGDDVPIWQDTRENPDGRDEDAKLAFANTLSISVEKVDDEAMTAFRKSVINRMRNPSLNCTECLDAAYNVGSNYCDQLHDIMLLYGEALNRTLEKDATQIRNGTEVVMNSDMTINGISGNITVNARGQLIPAIQVDHLDSNFKSQTIMTVIVEEDKVSKIVDINDDKIVWSHYKGKRPLSVPTCGFLGEKCSSFIGKNGLLVVIIAAVLIIAVIVLLLAGLYLWRQRVKEEKENEMKWQVPFNMLEASRMKKGKSFSTASLNSGETSKTDHSQPFNLSSECFEQFLYHGEEIVGKKHKSFPVITNKLRSHLRKMCDIDNGNVNRFIGLSLDGHSCLSLWKFCMRGSLKDVIRKRNVNMDGFFIFCLIKDVADGLSYLHNCFIEKHGCLTSSCCLVDARWEVKISDYGLGNLQTGDEVKLEHRLYTAPELLREPKQGGTKEGDMYSFAIICSELIGGTSAWNMENRKEDMEDILYMVKKGGKRIVRPELSPDPSLEIKSDLIHMVRDCWEEEPASRLTTQDVQKVLKGYCGKKNANLMDHVFKILENYASSLEEEVEARTKELVDEKKKSDILLCRMLPQSVVEKLRLGQAIIPESFDSVTIFFSDIVSFTELSSKCSPMQVVDFLNEFYTCFDNKIDERDVYKVETIGDAYLCVSGLPHRNGKEHIREIVTMSVSLLKDLRNFRIPHMPSYRVMIRIGVHSGSCVAGVVGLAMPKYCLFGDTVNTASRMESNGKPGKIHMSEQAATLLREHYPEFKTEPRGEVIIKGKGVMNTFWLVTDDESDSQIAL